MILLLRRRRRLQEIYKSEGIVDTIHQIGMKEKALQQLGSLPVGFFNSDTRIERVKGY